MKKPNSKNTWLNLIFSIFLIFSIGAIEFLPDSLWAVRIVISILLIVGGVISIVVNVMSLSQGKK